MLSKLYKSIIILILALSISSCENDERLVDNSVEKAHILIAHNESSPALDLLHYKDASQVSTGVFQSANSETLPAAVSKIQRYRDQLFLIMPDAMTIYIISPFDFKKIASIDFTSINKKPIDICFANATDAYVIFDKDSVVNLVDLTNNQIARTINLSGTTSDIEAYANQIIVACQSSDKAYIIDSRTHNKEASLIIHNKPSFVAFSNDGLTGVVLSLGKGKLNNNEEKTLPVLTYINMTTREISKTLEVKSNIYTDPNSFPNSMVTSQDDILYISANEFFFRSDSKYGHFTSTIKTGQFSQPYFYAKNSEIIALHQFQDEYQLYVFNAKSSEWLKTLNLNKAITSFILL